MSWTQRLNWNNAGQLTVAPTENTSSPAPCPSPGLGNFQDQMELDNFQAFLADEGCTPAEITLACQLVHSYLSKDIYDDAPLLVGVWEYVANALQELGIRDSYEHLSEPSITSAHDDDDDDGNNNEDAGITDLNALRIRTLLRQLTEEHLAMVLRFPFCHTADRAHAEGLCKIWLQLHYARRSKHYVHTRVILYDLYSNFENMFRRDDLPDIYSIPGWSNLGYPDKWAGLSFRPDAAWRSPQASRSSLRAPMSPTGDVFGARRRSNSLYLEPPKSPISANSSYTNLFDLQAQTPTREDKRLPWFLQHNDSRITVENQGEFPVWKTMYAHLVAGARLEYLVERKKVCIRDVLITLTNPDYVTMPLSTLTQQNALVDLAYYIFLRNRAINPQQAAFDRGVLETFGWPAGSQAGLDLTVRRLNEYLAPVPVRRSHLPALSFLSHVAASLQYANLGLEYRIAEVVRTDGSVVDLRRIQHELSYLRV